MKFINEKILFKGNIGRIRDIKIHKSGDLYLLTDRVNFGECISEKIFILTGEPSGDKLASKVIKELKKENSEIKYLSVGGENLKSLGIESIYDLKEITYIGFTNVILNIFKINKKINETVKVIKEFNPDIYYC